MVNIKQVESVPASDKAHSERLFEKEREEFENQHKLTKSTKKKCVLVPSANTTKRDRGELHDVGEQVTALQTEVHYLAVQFERLVGEVKKIGEAVQTSHASVADLAKEHAKNLIQMALGLKKDTM